MEETTGLSKQQKKSMETKAKIFKAAKRILQRSGYETLSIKNICEEAGVSNGSFYHHFKTKDDLLSYYIEDQRASTGSSGSAGKCRGCKRTINPGIFKLCFLLQGTGC